MERRGEWVHMWPWIRFIEHRWPLSGCVALKCEPQCSQCIGDANSCYEYAQGHVFTFTAIANNYDTGVCKCTDRTYDGGQGECLACNQVCATYYGPNSLDCLEYSCDTGSVWEYAENECICDLGHGLSNTDDPLSGYVALTCEPQCGQCIGDANSCYECAQGYVFAVTAITNNYDTGVCT